MTNKEFIESIRFALDFIFGEDGYFFAVFGIFIAVVNIVFIVSYVCYKIKVLNLRRDRRRSQTSDDK